MAHSKSSPEFGSLVHHHLLYQGRVGRSDLGADAEHTLRRFMVALRRELGMKELIAPQFAFSKAKAWTGIMGIVTSHIAFHYWTLESYVQMDIYSCKSFDRKAAIEYLDRFWMASQVRSVFLERNPGAFIMDARDSWS